MLRPLAGLLFALCLIFVSSSNAAEPAAKSAKERLVGNWEGAMKFDEAKFRASSAKKVTDDLERDRLEKDVIQYTAQAGRFRIKASFAIDGKATMVRSNTKDGSIDKSVSGTWEVLEEKGDQIKVRVVPDGKGYPTDESYLVFKDIDRLWVYPPFQVPKDDTPMVVELTRVK